MDKPKQLTKEQVREYLQARFRSTEPLPSKEEIDRQIGRTLIDAERKEQKRM